MTPSPQRQDAAESDAFSELLRGSLVPTAVVGAVAVLVAAFSGPKAAWSAALGVALVLAFFTISLLAMKRTAHLAPTAVMLVVMVTYTVKILALGIVMVLLRDATWVSGYAVGVTITICTLVWLYFEMRAYKRLRIFVFTPQPGGSDGDGER
ncbi:MAG: hypothetical protein ACOYBY_12565 [Dermatophilaceae bacterium]